MRGSRNIVREIQRGARYGVPVGLGYLAVAFSLGIAMQRIGMTPVQGFFMSLLNVASAGEYAGITAIETAAPIVELVILTVIINARYFLMSCSLSQRLTPETSILHRMLIGFGITDELFGIGVSQPYPLSPYTMYGAFLTSIPLWAIGTAIGIIAGNVFPPVVVQALSAAIFGMFIAIVVPPGRKDKRILVLVLVSFAASMLFSKLPFAANISESMRVILLTVVISCAAAVIAPIQVEAAKEAKEEVQE